MKSGLSVLVLTLTFSAASFAQAGSNDPDLSGTWLDSSNSAQKITFLEKGGNIQVHESDGTRVVADYSCTLSGAQCEVKENGKRAKVMMYYNGPKLVEIDERGSDVEKRRFSLGADGKTMQMEVIPISSPGKTITRTYQKEDSQVQVAKNPS